MLTHSFGRVFYCNPSFLNGSESLFFKCADYYLNNISKILSYVIHQFPSISSIGKDNLYSGTHFFKDSHQQISGFTVMYIGYGNHYGNKKTILIYYDMTFYTFG